MLKMSALRQTSSSSITSVDEWRYAGMDARKRKRMISNRDSARRLRMRKQKTLEDLANAVTILKCENNGIVEKIDKAAEGYMVFVAENNVLRAQAVELTERLTSLNSFLNCAGLNFDTHDMPDPLLQLWNIPCPLQPIMASFDHE